MSQGSAQTRSAATVVTFLLLVIAICWFVWPRPSPKHDATADLLPEIRAFLGEHPEYGRAVAVTDQPDWARGKRQTVTASTSDGLQDYLFYTENGKVVSVYAFTKERARVLVWEAP